MTITQRCRISVLLPILVGIALSCTSEGDTKLSPEEFDKFTAVYADLSVAMEMARQDTSVYFPMRDSVLTSHGVDTTWVRDMERKLDDDLQQWLEVWDAITNKLEAQKDSLTR